MKYFAKLGLNSKVVAVHTVHDNDAPTEEAGIEFLNKITNYPFWKEGSKDGSLRKNGAAVGMIYDEDRDAFYWKNKPKENPSFIFDETLCAWVPPISMPDDGKKYIWNESTKSWDEIIK